MMDKRELRTLKGQALLLAGLFGICIVGAVGMVIRRDLFERFIKENYSVVPTAIRAEADRIAAGKLDAELFDEMPDAERLLFYDDWMTREEPPPLTPRMLAQTSPTLYLARAERTLVCGSAAQRRRGLDFLELAGRPEAIPILQKAMAWAERRGDGATVERAREIIDRLERGAPAPAGEKLKTKKQKIMLIIRK